MRSRVRKITDLSHLDQISRWMYGWWGQEEGYSRDEVRNCMARSFQDEGLPQTYGLFVDDALVGIYQFVLADLFVRPDLYPWLANVYVSPDLRGQGFGDELMRSVMSCARAALPFDGLYLYTTHRGFYERYGWSYMGDVDTFLAQRVQRLYRLDVR